MVAATEVEAVLGMGFVVGVWVREEPAPEPMQGVISVCCR
jgi:hypothetical protein